MNGGGISAFEEIAERLDAEELQEVRAVRANLGNLRFEIRELLRTDLCQIARLRADRWRSSSTVVVSAVRGIRSLRCETGRREHGVALQVRDRRRLRLQRVLTAGLIPMTGKFRAG